MDIEKAYEILGWSVKAVKSLGENDKGGERAVQ